MTALPPKRERGDRRRRGARRAAPRPRRHRQRPRPRARVADVARSSGCACPRFDSPSVFARLLDSRNGGTFRVLAGDREVRGQPPLPRRTRTSLATRFELDGAAWEIIDYAPRIPEGLGVRVPLEIVRIVRPLAGHPKLRIDFDPRPDYAPGARRDARDDARHRGPRRRRAAAPGDEHPVPVRARAARVRADQAACTSS